MATVSNSSSLQADNSPRQSRKSSRVSSPSIVSPLSLPVSGMVDPEKFLTYSSMASDSLPVKEANTVEAACNSSAEDDLVAPAGEDVQIDNGDNGGVTKKPAWNKLSNGLTAEVVDVMGAGSWPALSESARASPKSPSIYSLKASPYESVAISQELAVGSSSSPKEVSTSISTLNHVVPSRQRSMKRGGGGGGGSSGHNPTVSHDSLSQAPPVVDVSPSNPGKSGEEHSRDNINKDGGQRGGSYSGNESQPRRSFRRNNSGPLTRVDGSYHGSYGGRRDYERGKQDLGNRSFGSRESQQRVGPQPFLRGPAPNAPFIPPPLPPVAVRPFVSPVVYTEMPSSVFYVPGPHSDSLRPMPMVSIQSMFFPMPDPHLPTKIVNQIEYYFSNENLVKDTFLRQNMDGEGWVSIKLIAGFKKVMQLTDNIQLILDAVKASNVVEVQGDKVRRKTNWMKWIMPPVQTPVTSPQSINRSSQNILAAHLNSVALDEKAAS